MAIDKSNPLSAIKIPNDPHVEFENSAGDALKDILSQITGGDPSIDRAKNALRAAQGEVWDFADSLDSLWQQAKGSLSREGYADALARSQSNGANAHGGSISMMKDYPTRKLVGLSASLLDQPRLDRADAAAKECVDSIEAVRRQGQRERTILFSLERISWLNSPALDAQAKLLVSKGPEALRVEWQMALEAMDGKDWRNNIEGARPEIDRGFWLAMIAESVIDDWRLNVMPKLAAAARGETELTRLQNQKEVVAPRLLHEINDWRRSHEDEAAEPYEIAYRQLVAGFQIVCGINLSLSAPWAGKSKLDVENFINMRPGDLDLYVDPSWLIRQAPPFSTAPVGWTRRRRYQGKVVREPYMPSDPSLAYKR